jgi:hypothetical protein
MQAPTKDLRVRNCNYRKFISNTHYWEHLADAVLGSIVRFEQTDEPKTIRQCNRAAE